MTGVGFGLVPREVGGADLQAMPHEGVVWPQAVRREARQAMVIAEVAVALLAVMVAGASDSQLRAADAR